MDSLPAETLLALVETYETAIVELHAMNDRAVDGLVLRLAHHRADAIAQLANQDAVSFAGRDATSGIDRD